MNAPFVSIIVPVYNVDKYLPKCLDSLIRQTLHNIEIICVDDGSTDNSKEIIQEYCKKDARIRYIYQKNEGVASARNTGLNAVQAPYLMFCDPDDWYDEIMCEKMYQTITEHNVDFACCGVNIYYETDTRIKNSDDNYYRINFSGIHPINDNIFSKVDVSLWNKIFDVSLIKKYDIVFPKGKIYEDACFFFQYFTVSQKAYFLTEKLYNYVRHSGSIMNTTFKTSEKALDHIKILNDIFDFLKKNNLWDKKKEVFYSAFLNYYLFARKWFPQDKKDTAAQEALSLIERLDLTAAEKVLWTRTILNHVKVVKIAGITLLKIKSIPQKTSVFVLGIQIYSRKIKKDKEIFSILYIPFLKRRIPNE